jgi:hypothetical protein
MPSLVCIKLHLDHRYLRKLDCLSFMCLLLVVVGCPNNLKVYKCKEVCLICFQKDLLVENSQKIENADTFFVIENILF